MLLTRNFLLEEFVCPCCNEVSVDWRLLTALQQLRDALGVPLLINSGFRCAKHNHSVNGAEGSYHTIGLAADIKVPSGMSLVDFFLAAEKVEFLAGFGVDMRYMHVDVRSRPEYWVYKAGRILVCQRSAFVDEIGSLHD